MATPSETGVGRSLGRLLAALVCAEPVRSFEVTPEDPLLAELAYPRQLKLAAERRLRLLVATPRRVSPSTTSR